MTTVWVTKYWETRGIFTREGHIAEPDEFATPYFIEDSPSAQRLFLRPSAYRETLEEARQQVEELRKKRIVQLRKKIEKLEALDPSTMGLGVG